MTFPSLLTIFHGTSKAVRRFPWVIAGAFVCWGLSCAVIHQSSRDEDLWRIISPAVLSLSLFFAMSVYAERSPKMRYPDLFPILGLIGLSLYYLSGSYSTMTIYSYRFWQFNLAFHLLVAVIPYLATQESNGFWQYNRILFQRFLIGAVYAAILYVGTVMALEACRRLFDITIPSRLFGYIWASISFIFHPLYFLAGVPEDWEALNSLEEYPIVLRVLVQYILIPLLTVYFLILYVYMAKIIGLRT